MANITISATSASVLMKAYCNAAEILGLTAQVQAEILGIHRTTLIRNANKGLQSNPKACELQLHFIHLYQALYALTGGELQAMKYWFTTHNKILKAIPADCCQSVHGLIRTVQYLQFIQHKN